jgi:hypothetical protein
MYFNFQTALTCIICAPLIFGVVGYKVLESVNSYIFELKKRK